MTIAKSNTKSIFPAGSLSWFSASSVANLPAGWLACSGQTLPRASYPDLFSAIGTQFNTGGEAVTDFRLPALASQTIVGMDNMGTARAAAGRHTGTPASTRGGTGGSTTVTLDISHLPVHSHPTNETAHGHAVSTGFHSHPSGATTGEPPTTTLGFQANTGQLYYYSVGSTYSTTSSVNILLDNPPYSSLGYSIQPTSAAAPHDNMQPYITLNAYVKT